jgi:FK506-binding nuclear protein
MSSRRDRIVAWVGVIVAALSAVALSAVVIIQQVITDRNAKQQPTVNQSTAQACADNNTEQPLPVPDVYKPSGAVTKLQADDLSAGTGAGAKAGDCLVVKYYGTLAATGVKFDEDFTTTAAFAFTLGQGQVIPGWDQGLLGMQSGGLRRLVIPAALAYGSQSQGSIPANSALVFAVKLLRIQK